VPPPDRTPPWREVLIVKAALDTGLLEAFREPAAPAAVAAARGLDARASRIVAAALCRLGHLEGAGEGALRLTASGAALVAPPGADDDPAGELELEARSIASYLRLPEVLRTGAPPDDVSGGDPATRRRFMRAMRHIAGPRAPETVAAVGPPSGRGRLLDVGGAPGTYARAFAAAGWRVTVLDLPDTLALGAPELEAAGVATRAGDMTAALPEGTWDAVYLGNVVHRLGPAEAAALVARAGAALAPGGLLAVQEVLGDAGPQPGFGVMMLLSTPAGDAYTADDHRGWMAAAGCPAERVVEIEGGAHHLLLGRRTG
jgi:hypothetical protein